MWEKVISEIRTNCCRTGNTVIIRLCIRHHRQCAEIEFGLTRFIHHHHSFSAVLGHRGYSRRVQTGITSLCHHGFSKMRALFCLDVLIVKDSVAGICSSQGAFALVGELNVPPARPVFLRLLTFEAQVNLAFGNPMKRVNVKEPMKQQQKLEWRQQPTTRLLAFFSLCCNGKHTICNISASQGPSLCGPVCVVVTHTAEMNAA